MRPEPCCDDYLPCYCDCKNFDDYDFITKQRETLQREIENVENASEEDKELYAQGKLRYADLARPVPEPVRHYPAFTWRSGQKVEDAVKNTVRKVAETEEGNRNNVLASASYFFGKLIQAGNLSMEHGIYWLGQAARDAKLPLHEASITVRLGVQAGMRKEATHPYVERNTSVGRGATRAPFRPDYFPE